MYEMNIDDGERDKTDMIFAPEGNIRTLHFLLAVAGRLIKINSSFVLEINEE